MSITSYRRNVSTGATGLYTPTCFPAALEQISPEHRLQPSDYRRYRGGIGTLNRLFSEGGQSRRQINPFSKRLFASIIEPSGCDLYDVEFRRVRNSYNLGRLVHSALNQACRVSVDLNYGIKDESHTVGLIELEDGRFELVSNHVPFGLKVSSLDEIFPHLDQSKDQPSVRYPFMGSNVTILPAGG